MRRVLLGLTVLLGTGFGAEAVAVQETAGGWVFTSLPHVDLWFHGMALVDPIGPGPNPLYDPGYPNEIRRAKGEIGAPSTALDTRLGYFREAFQRDPAFELLHFLPLYFPRAGRVEFFSALKSLVGTAEGIPRAPSAHAAFGVTAVGSVLTTRSQRSVLGEFVSALEAEWDNFFEGHWQERAAPREQTLGSLRESWRVRYLPGLAPFLDGVGMSGGVIALVSAIGVEGRIFGGSPQNPADNVLVLSSPPSPERGREAVFSMLRELSFPLVRGVMDRTGNVAGNRDQGEGLASRAAIRSGALILEMACPEELMEYQQFFLTQAGRSVPAGEAVDVAFREAYSLEVDFEEALREEIFTRQTTGGIE